MASMRLSVVCAFVLCIGCSSDDAPQKLTLNNLPAYPTHWRIPPGRGTDSQVGQLMSTQNKLVINYDIGELAGEYADAKAYPDHQWVKVGELAGSSFQYLLNKDETLYVTFSNEGPANFWTKISDNADIDYVIELLARYRKQMLAAAYSASADELPKKVAVTLYDGFENDQVALRKTVRLKVTSALTDSVNASSPEACEAARRVFGRVSFLFKKRDDILKLLGDPATISDYNERAKADPNAPLVYVFDSGFGGWRYTLTCNNGECFGIEAESLN